MPARYSINFVELLAANKISGEVDLSSLQVHKYNPVTGAAEKFKPFDYAISEYDHPCRFDDDALPEDYPSYIGYSSDYKEGRPPVTITKRKGRPVSYTHLRAHETDSYLVCRLLLEKKKN